MAETEDAERRELRAEFVRAFLSAAHYSDFEIGMLGDLSRVKSEQVEALLNAKLEEMKAIEDVVRNPPEFKLLGGADKKKRD